MDNKKQIIFDSIRDYSRRKWNLALFAGILNSAALLLVIWLSTIIADSVFFFSTPTRWLILVLNSALTVQVLRWFVSEPLRHRLKIDDTRELLRAAHEIGYHFDQLSDRLVNSFQLADERNSGTSDQLRELAVTQIAENLKSIQVTSRLNLKKFLLSPLLIGSIFIGSLASAGLMPDVISVSMKRIFYPPGRFSRIPEYQFKIMPGNASLIQGEDVNIWAAYAGPAAKNIFLKIRSEKDSDWQTRELKKEDNYYRAALKNIRRPFSYYLQAEPEQAAEWSAFITSKPYLIEVKIPPVISELQAEIQAPAYTALPRQFPEKNVGDIFAYPGSRINWRISSSKTLQSARLVLSDSSALPVRVRENRIQAEFIPKQSISYFFELTDKEGIKNRKPIRYSITMLQDLYPTVEVLSPGEDIEIPNDVALNLEIEANDDFGFSVMQLHYQIISSVEGVGDSSWQMVRIPFDRKARKYVITNYMWDFSQLPLGYGDMIRYYVSVSDNDRISGPKLGKSPYYTISFPSLEKMFSEFSQKQEEKIDETGEITRQSEELRKELEKINRELKREKQLDWQRRKEIEAVAEKQKQIQERLEKIRKEMEEAINQMQENQMLSPEVLEKYRQLQEMFRELASPELLAALEKLQKALENMNKQQVQKALSQLKFNQERFKENLERTLELFKKVQMEQELDRLVKTAEKLAAEQEKLTEQLKNNNLTSEERSGLEQKQEQQKQSLEQLQKSMEMLSRDEMFASRPETQQSLEKSSEFIEERRLTRRMQDTRNQMGQGNTSKASETSQGVQQDLQEMSEQLKKARQQMLEQEKNMLMAKMQRTTRNLLNLSQGEEKLMKLSGKLSGFSDQFRELANRQNRLNENMSRAISELIDISKETFFISPEISKALGTAQHNMRKSVENLADRNQQAAGQNQKKAMAALNRAVMEMQNSMQMMQQSGSALGFEQFLQRMQQMAGQQGQLNQESLNFMQGKGNQGGLTSEQQAQLRRMAAQQNAIRKSLEQLHNEAGNRSDVLGRLENMADEMEKVVKDLEMLKIDRKTIERQQKILSRMLDAQKSVRERKFSKKRKAEVGRFYTRKSPKENQETVDKRKQALTKEMLRALREGYSPDYEKLIERYYRELNKKDLN